MNKDALLKTTAETGYNIGYAAKKHLATFDIVDKLPGWIAVISLATGVFALINPALGAAFISAIFIVIGIASLFLNFYTDQRNEYSDAGSHLTTKFHELRLLYHSVKSMPDNSDFTKQIDELKAVQASAQTLNLKKQVFLSDWYAHYKFFWQSQTSWMDEQLKFTLLRDKLPLSFSVCVTILIVFLAYSGISQINMSAISAICGGTK